MPMSLSKRVFLKEKKDSPWPVEPLSNQLQVLKLKVIRHQFPVKQRAIILDYLTCFSLIFRRKS